MTINLPALVEEQERRDLLSLLVVLLQIDQAAAQQWMMVDGIWRWSFGRFNTQSSPQPRINLSSAPSLQSLTIHPQLSLYVCMHAFIH